MKKSSKITSALVFMSNALIAGSVALGVVDFDRPAGLKAGSESLTSVAQQVVGAMKWIGIVVAVIMIIYVGIKYLTAGAGVKADVKSNLVPMLAGAILIGSAGIIVDAVFNAVTVNTNGTP